MKTIYFFKAGTFSHQNPLIADLLRRGFPDDRLRIVDVLDEIVLKSPGTALRALWESWFDYRRAILRNRHHPKIYFAKTRAADAAVQRWARRLVEPDATRFTFQTQSLFNASRAGVPHFLYTDHTYLANFRYADAAFVPDAPADWLERERIFYSAARVCFATSSFATKSLVEDYALPPERVACIYCGGNAVERAMTAELAPKAHSGTRILFVGLEWERKGGPELLQAFEKVAAEVADAELWIVGCDPATSHPRIRVLGKQPIEEVSRLFDEADLFCLPSRKEPSAVVLSEAALHGLPAVATDVGGTVDRVIDGETGFLVPPGDAAALAHRLIELCRDPARRAVMGAAAKRLAEERFSWAAVGARMVTRIREELAVTSAA